MASPGLLSGGHYIKVRLSLLEAFLSRGRMRFGHRSCPCVSESASAMRGPGHGEELRLRAASSHPRQSYSSSQAFSFHCVLFQIEAHLDTLINEQASYVLTRAGLSYIYSSVQQHKPQQVSPGLPLTRGGRQGRGGPARAQLCRQPCSG